MIRLLAICLMLTFSSSKDFEISKVRRQAEMDISIRKKSRSSSGSITVDGSWKLKKGSGLIKLSSNQQRTVIRFDLNKVKEIRFTLIEVD